MHAQTSAAAAKETQAKQKPEKQQKQPANASDNYDDLFEKYLREARATAANPPADQSYAWMSNLNRDFKARRVNDLVTIDVVENITGAGSADAATNKASSGSAAVPSLFGLESHLPGNPSSLVSAKSSTDFTGSGQTSRSGQLTALVTARVSEVLPSGDLVVEGVHEIDINGDRQIVVVTGVVRGVDIGPTNHVTSTAIGQMRIRYFGRGLMKDNLTPGWLVRVLNKIF